MFNCQNGYYISMFLIAIFLLIGIAMGYTLGKCEKIRRRIKNGNS